MEINKTTGLKLWDERIGRSIQKATDFSGREMHRGLYGVTTSDKGWNIDHIMPKALGGTDEKDNLEIVNQITNFEKGDNTTFTANEQKFQVQKSKNGKYVIVKIDDKKTDESISRLVLFKRDVSDDTDFAGRRVKQSEFNTNHDEAWTIGFFTNDNKMSNAYVAHKQTVEEQSGKTSFKANGYEFKLRKIDHKYLFINQSDILDQTDYYSVFSFSDKHIDNDPTLYKDVVTIALENRYKDEWISRVVIIFEKIVKSHKLDYNLIISNNSLDNHLHFIFDTPDKSDSCKVHEVAMYFNSMKHYLREKGFNDEFFSIYHWSENINSSELFSFYKSISQYFDNINIGYYSEEFNLYVHKDVVNYLKECKYRNDSFITSNHPNWFIRNYIYTKLVEDVKKYFRK